MRVAPIHAMIVMWSLSLPSCPARAADAPQGGVDPNRVEQIGAMLGERPFAFGPKIDDRAAWERLAESANLRGAVARAEKLLDEPLPELTDELYLDYSRTGNRDRYQSAYGARRARLARLAVAECVENDGRFVEPLEHVIRLLCGQKSWVLPAHDRNLENFNGTRITIDLASSYLGNELAQVRYLLGDRLSPEVRKLIDDNVRRRVIDPFRDMIEGKRPADWWITGENNWNSVCLANVLGAAMATLESRHERALFAAAAEKYSQNFLTGFSDDGYCSEGLAYWNYGFSHYVRMAELLWQATDGRIDLYDRPKVLAVTLYPARLQIVNDVYPAFADCNVNEKPDAALVDLLNARFNLGIDRWKLGRPVGLHGNAMTTLMYACPNSATSATAAGDRATGASTRPVEVETLRSFFEDAGVLACRPEPGSAGRIAVSLKGGHNAEQHNHNDVGSYVVVVGKHPILLDPGAEVYTRRTFSKDRYQSDLLNSFGHPVPVVAGKLQRTGRDAHAEVVRREFTHDADTFAIDIRSCYEVPELTKLTRTFVYSREGEGSLTVTDEVAFSSPQSFGTAIVTLGEWEQLSPTALLVREGEAAVEVEIDGGAAEFAIDPQTLQADARTKKQPMRIGINLTKPATAAKVRLTIRPAR